MLEPTGAKPEVFEPLFAFGAFDVIAGREIRRIRHVYSETPGGLEARLEAVFGSIERVYVNGVETVHAGATSGKLPGTVLRSGRDTETVATA